MRLPLLIGFLLASVAPAACAATVFAEGATRTLECAGGNAAIEGNRNTIAFTGACRGLSVHGDANTVSIELAPGAALDVQGNANHIRYTLTPPPALRINGRGTDIAAAEGMPPHSPSISLTGDGATLDLDCTGREVVIHGTRSRYTLRGGCRSLAANGDGNRIVAEVRPDASLTVTGNDTDLSYSVLGSGEPAITVRGVNSRAERTGNRAPFAGEAPVPPPPPDDALAPVPLPDLSATDVAVPTPPATVTAPHLSVLLHALGARVIAAGTEVSTSADDLFQPGADALRHGAEPRLREVIALAALIHPSAVRITATDPADDKLAARRARALQAWLNANGLAVQTAGAGTAASAAMDILLAR